MTLPNEGRRQGIGTQFYKRQPLTRLPTWGGVVMSCHSVTLRVSTGQGHQTY